MADVNSQVALGINAQDPNQGLNTLSKIMGLGQQGLAIRGQQSQNQSLAAKATIDTQTAKENQALAGLMSDPIKNGLVDQNGSPTKDAQTIIMQAAPTTGSQHYENLVNAATKKVAFNSSVNSLRTSERAELGQAIAGVTARAESPSDITDAIDALVASKKGTPEETNYSTIAETAKAAINHLANQTKGSNAPVPGKEPWRMGAANIATSISGTGPAAQNTGAGVVNRDPVTGALTQPPGAATGSAINPTIPPGYQMLNGQLVKIADSGVSLPDVRQPSQPPAKPGGLQPLPKPALNAPKADQDRYLAQTADSTKHVQDVSAAANDPQNGTQVSRYRNAQILSILNKGDAQTGPNKELLNHIESTLTGGNSGTPYQTIGHYLAQNSAAVAAKMGVPNTNMGSEQAAASAGNVRQNPDAIKEITKVNDGVNTALDLYNKGLSKATNNGANTDKVPAFRQAFGQNFDMNLFRYEDAVRNGDKAEIDKIAKSLGPQGMQQLGAKRKVIQSLANTGDLPGG
jgi:hypothetical protein